MISEQDVYDSWKQLFYGRRVTGELLDQGDALLQRLKPESPLRFRLARELEEFRGICERQHREAERQQQLAERQRQDAERKRLDAERKAREAEARRQEAEQKRHQAAAEREAARAAQRANGTQLSGTPRLPSRPRGPSQQEILTRVAAGTLSAEEAARLLSQAAPGRSLSCRVSEKGALSVYGLQRMPVTLYVQQWDRLIDFFDDIREFITAHEAELSRKSRNEGNDEIRNPNDESKSNDQPMTNDQ